MNFMINLYKCVFVFYVVVVVVVVVVVFYFKNYNIYYNPIKT